MKIDIMQDMMNTNLAYAAENKAAFAANGIYAINVLGSPGAGKTTLLETTFHYLQGKVSSAVVEGDLATARDAARIAACGVPVIQINTEGGCHLDAKMVAKTLGGFDLENIDLMVIENVGNLVCPAAYDLGEHEKILVMSLTEGGDKPAKYPTAFLAAKAVVLNKFDLLPYIGVDAEKMKKEILGINPQIKIFETSCREGQVFGVDKFGDYLLEKASKHRAKV